MLGVDTPTLTLVDAHPRIHAGVYTCIAENSFGRADSGACSVYVVHPRGGSQWMEFHASLGFFEEFDEATGATEPPQDDRRRQRPRPRPRVIGSSFERERRVARLAGKVLPGQGASTADEGREAEEEERSARELERRVLGGEGGGGAAESDWSAPDATLAEANETTKTTTTTTATTAASMGKVTDATDAEADAMDGISHVHRGKESAATPSARRRESAEAARVAAEARAIEAAAAHALEANYSELWQPDGTVHPTRQPVANSAARVGSVASNYHPPRTVGAAVRRLSAKYHKDLLTAHPVEARPESSSELGQVQLLQPAAMVFSSNGRGGVEVSLRGTSALGDELFSLDDSSGCLASAANHRRRRPQTAQHACGFTGTTSGGGGGERRRPMTATGVASRRPEEKNEMRNANGPGEIPPSAAASVVSPSHDEKATPWDGEGTRPKTTSKTRRKYTSGKDKAARAKKPSSKRVFNGGGGAGDVVSARNLVAEGEGKGEDEGEGEDERSRHEADDTAGPIDALISMRGWGDDGDDVEDDVDGGGGEEGWRRGRSGPWSPPNAISPEPEAIHPRPPALTSAVPATATVSTNPDRPTENVSASSFRRRSGESSRPASARPSAGGPLRATPPSSSSSFRGRERPVSAAAASVRFGTADRGGGGGGIDGYSCGQTERGGGAGATSRVSSASRDRRLRPAGAAHPPSTPPDRHRQRRHSPYSLPEGPRWSSAVGAHVAWSRESESARGASQPQPRRAKPQPAFAFAVQGVHLRGVASTSCVQSSVCI